MDFFKKLRATGDMIFNPNSKYNNRLIDGIFGRERPRPEKPIVYEKFNNQPYGGKYNPTTDQITVVNQPTRMGRAYTKAHVIPHERGHQELYRGINAFNPLADRVSGSQFRQEPTIEKSRFAPLNPMLNIRDDELPHIQKQTREQILGHPNLYKDDYRTYMHEFYANRNVDRRNRASDIYDNYFRRP